MNSVSREALGTVVIVSVAVAISLVVALYLTGVVRPLNSYRSTPILEVSDVHIINESNSFILIMVVKNNGAQATVIRDVSINGTPVDDIDAVTMTKVIGVRLEPGEQLAFQLRLPKTQFRPGGKIEITINGDIGREAKTVIELPGR